MKRSILVLVQLVIASLLFACATTPNSEMDQYDGVRGGTVYKRYQDASAKAMAPIVEEYNERLVKIGKPKIGDSQIHTTLALLWIVAAQSKLALAETELALAQTSDPRERYAAITIQAVAMHEEGWPDLAKQSAIEARKIAEQHRLGEDYANAAVLARAAGGALALVEGNVLFVANETRELGVATDQEWMISLGEATHDAYTGATESAITKLEELKRDPKLSDGDRKGVDKVIGVVRAGGKNMPSDMASAVVQVSLLNVVQRSSLTPQILEQLPKNYRAIAKDAISNS